MKVTFIGVGSNEDFVGHGHGTRGLPSRTILGRTYYSAQRFSIFSNFFIFLFWVVR